MKLANKNETTINPATEDTLLGVKTAVEAISGGGDGAINDGVSTAIKATVHDYTNSNPLAVVLRDTNGDYVSVGGGTQYADGAVRGTATGTIAMGDDGTNIQAIAVDSDGKIKIEDAIQELLSRLSFLPSVRGIAADLRVTLLSGTVTTVTNVTNLVNMGGHTAAQLIPHATNQVAILSNINNCII